MKVWRLNPYFISGAITGFITGLGAAWALVNFINDKTEQAAQRLHEAALENEKRRADDSVREYKEKCELRAAEKDELSLCRDKAQMLDATVCGVKLAKLQAEHAVALRNQEVLQVALDEKSSEMEKLKSSATSACVPDAASGAPHSPARAMSNDGGKPPIRIDWETTASQWCRNVDQTFQFECPANGVVYNVYGATQYTCKSSICTAATHAGLIKAVDGGLVNVRILGSTGKRENGVTRNGISSEPNHALWFTESSFTFEK